ncbi:MAG: PAS domain-containing methyl-accepting chemotaxis protein [Acidimicrobiaceae bacterium]|nr:PAS domain-containing methyl-accepting chemotaxis protein [Acidimicrobiaceae bacterium]
MTIAATNGRSGKLQDDASVVDEEANDSASNSETSPPSASSGGGAKASTRKATQPSSDKGALDGFVTIPRDELNELRGKLEAISKSQAMIELNLDGTIITANDNFLTTLGYGLNEIKGRHHRMFVDPEYGRSAEYEKVWEGFRKGEVKVGEFKRVGKGGREVWLHGAYNPIFDVDGKPFKVIEYATDVTTQVAQRIQLQEGIKDVMSIAEGVTESASEMAALSEQMGANSTEASAQAEAVSSAAEQVSANLQTVSAAAEELATSIVTVANNASDAARVAGTAVEAAESTKLTMDRLGTSSREISTVIKVITSIAQQTNLLALNATIEAARAGESGKGFAVVANEVKELAKQTAQATEDIGRRIETTQSDTAEAVNAINEIAHIIDQINAISGTIAEAVKEQQSTTGAIAQNISEAAVGSGEIARNITGVAQAAESTSKAVSKNQEHTMGLIQVSSELRAVAEKLRSAS